MYWKQCHQTRVCSSVIFHWSDLTDVYCGCTWWQKCFSVLLTKTSTWTFCDGREKSLDNYAIIKFYVPKLSNIADYNILYLRAVFGASKPIVLGPSSQNLKEFLVRKVHQEMVPSCSVKRMRTWLVAKKYVHHKMSQADDILAPKVLMMIKNPQTLSKCWYWHGN